MRTFQSIDRRPGRPFTLDDAGTLREALAIYPSRPRILIRADHPNADDLRATLWTMGALPVTSGPSLASYTIHPCGFHFVTDPGKARPMPSDFDAFVTEGSRLPAEEIMRRASERAARRLGRPAGVPQ